MNSYWQKAVRSARTARLLIADGDPNGAASRAYYSMFNAVRALLDSRTELRVEDIRRHSAVLKLFSAHAVRTGLVDRRLYTAIHRAFELRAIADYDKTDGKGPEAEEIVNLHGELLHAIEQHISDRA